MMPVSFLPLLGLSLLSVACASTGHLPTTTILVKDIPMKVEVADDAGERARGLQHRESMPADEGMIFVYPAPKPLHFWMEYTLIPLSIAYIDENGKIVRIADMRPLDRTSIPSLAPAAYALEVNQGWFAAHGVQVGDKVLDLPPMSSAQGGL